MTQFDIQSFLDSGAFLRSQDGFVYLWANLKESSFSNFEPSSIFAKEFFEKSFNQYKFASTYKLSEAEFGSVLKHYLETSEKSLESIELTIAKKENFEDSFVEIMNRIHRGEIIKAVPIMFAESQNNFNSSELSIWKASTILKVLKAPQSLWAYGFWNDSKELRGGCIGATPEVLFQQNGNSVESMALAGSCPRSEIESRLPLLKDPKEMREHQLVIDDIKNVLSKLGPVFQGQTEVIEFPQILHLRTQMRVNSNSIDPIDLAQKMHPTAALGVTPRNYGIHWLTKLPGQEERQHYGSPIVFPLPDGSVALVAIRTLQWDSKKFRLGAGGGLVDGSSLDQEWREVLTKWRTTCDLLGLKLNEH